MKTKDTPRDTRLRHSLHNVLQKARAPMTVPHIQTLLKKGGMHPHKTSLYRNLERMNASGEIECVMLDTQVAYYEMQQEHHHHIVCARCRTIACLGHETMEKQISAIVKEVEKQSEFVIMDHHVSFVGVCKKCDK